MGARLDARQDDAHSNSERARQTLKRWGWAYKIKPRLVSARMVSLLAPANRRAILPTDMGVRLYLDPLTHVGRRVVRNGIYEPDTAKLISAHLSEGDVFIDVGAKGGGFQGEGGPHHRPHRQGGGSRAATRAAGPDRDQLPHQRPEQLEHSVSGVGTASHGPCHAARLFSIEQRHIVDRTP